jgi:hypothetical protein
VVWQSEVGKEILSFLRKLRIGYTFGGFKFQVQQWDSLSLQRSEMFIVASARVNVFAPLGATPVSGTTAEQAEALRSYGANDLEKESPAINISPLWGEATNLHLLSDLKIDSSPRCRYCGKVNT